jgi:hypothetical protein
MPNNPATISSGRIRRTIICFLFINISLTKRLHRLNIAIRQQDTAASLLLGTMATPQKT